MDFNTLPIFNWQRVLLCDSKNKPPAMQGGGQIFRYKYELLC